MKIKLLTVIYDTFQFFKFALKNIWRNRRRTVITMSGIAIGTLTLVLLNSYINTMYEGLKGDAIKKQYGHLQIAVKGYFDADENSPDHMMNEQTVDKIITKAKQSGVVDFVNIRVHLAGIIGTQKKSTIFIATAGIPAAEETMSPKLLKGNFLSEKDPSGIMIGEGMAKKLGVDVGDSLVAFVASASGSQEAIMMVVRGIYDALMPEQEKIVIYIPIKAAWDLVLEKKVHRVLFFMKDLKELPGFVKNMQHYIDENHLNLEIRDWESLAILLKQIVGMFQGMVMVVGIILFLVIIFNIQNTMHMSIHERFREIGAMRAMGSSRMEIMRAFLVEGFFIGLLGSLAGIVIALILMPWINSMHLNLPPGPGQDKPTPVSFNFTNAILLKAVIVNLVTAFLASISPALKGSKIKVIDALRYV